jgi:L,D-transpeptidase YbiS
MKSIVTESEEKDYQNQQLILQKLRLSVSKFLLYFNNSFFKGLIISISILTAIIGFALTSVFILPSIDNLALSIKSRIEEKSESDSAYILSVQYISDTEKRVQKLNEQLLNKTPKTSYIVVSTFNNHFYLYKNRNLVRDGLCSTGSYIKLEGEGEQQWIFKTPRGEFKIRGKTTSPVWKKPDWAFIEEGLPIPSKNHSSRYEYGSLGDYALSLGDGYLIHGTLYQRFLGMPVTHGCVRLGDEDLKQVFTTLMVGSKVYIF